MDPDANLAEQRRLLRKFRMRGRLTAGEASRLAELADALDEWISKGGFLPAAWNREESRDRAPADAVF